MEKLVVGEEVEEKLWRWSREGWKRYRSRSCRWEDGRRDGEERKKSWKREEGVQCDVEKLVVGVEEEEKLRRRWSREGQWNRRESIRGVEGRRRSRKAKRGKVVEGIEENKWIGEKEGDEMGSRRMRRKMRMMREKGKRRRKKRKRKTRRMIKL